MSAALDLLARVPNVLVFLTALTIVSECCSITGLFDDLAARIVRLARGQVWVTWTLLMAMSCVVTASLSLDTTAVLMTSAVIAVARQLRRPVAAFALPTLWIANMASMWLPVSNLTTLLARDVLPHPDTLSYLSASWPVALATTVTPLVIAAVMFRRHLGGRVSILDVPPPQENAHENHAEPVQTARRLIACVVGVMSIGLLFVEPSIVASLAAFACACIVFIKLPEQRQNIQLPWSSLGITTGLFMAVAFLHGCGVLNSVVRGLSDAPSWQLALAGGVGANIINNLPAYLALEPAAHGDSTRVLALLIGVNVISSLTWWGSVATLLWRDRLRRAGDDMSLRTHLARTGFTTLLTAGTALAVLSLTH